MNSTKFVERLQEARTGPEDLLVSFDVTSLFTQVPLDEALEVVKARLNKHSAPLQPSLWLSYVDNTFVIWPHGEWDMLSFHAHFNQMSTNIQFTIEKEKEGRLAFLDVLVTCSKDQLSTAVYRKPTHTELYIPYLLTTIPEC